MPIPPRSSEAAFPVSSDLPPQVSVPDSGNGIVSRHRNGALNPREDSSAAGSGGDRPAPPPGQASLVVHELEHWFGSGTNTRQVLDRVNLTIHRGEVVLLTGPSGCGKTTFLTLVGALRQVMAGSVQLFGQELNGAGRRERQLLRRQIGMIFQGHNLLRCLSAEQNVQMGADLLPGLGYRARRDGAREWLRAVGLGDHLDKLPHDLSGGQKQRVAIARALAAQPQLLLADEPTAALDSRTGREVVELLRRLARDQGCSVLMVTHDPRILDVADRLVEMEDGRLSEANIPSRALSGSVR
jgi:putative ABC transport system ATP-binding protein